MWEFAGGVGVGAEPLRETNKLPLLPLVECLSHGGRGDVTPAWAESADNHLGAR